MFFCRSLYRAKGSTSVAVSKLRCFYQSAVACMPRVDCWKHIHAHLPSLVGLHEGFSSTLHRGILGGVSTN